MIKFNSKRQLKPFIKQLNVVNTFQYLSHLQSPEIQSLWGCLDIQTINRLFANKVYDDRSKKVAISYLPNILNYIYLAKYRSFKIQITPNNDENRFVKLSIKFNERQYTCFTFNANHIVYVEHSSNTFSTNFSICASDRIVNKWKIERCFPLCLGGD